MKKIKKQAFSIIRFFFGWPLSIVAILLILKITLGNSEKLNFNFSEIKFAPLFYSLIFFSFYFFLRNLLWQQILKEKGHLLPLKTTTFLWAYSELRRFVPGKFWSFLSRAMLFSKEGISQKTIASSILIEIEFFLLGSFLVSLFALPFILNEIVRVEFKQNLITNATLFLTFLFLIFFIFNKSLTSRIKRSFTFITHLLPDFSPKTNLKLIMISSISFFSFGLGTYFSIAAFAELTNEMFLIFVGFFSFSFLAGYLSVIAPMGLGVREGIITLGLSKVMSLQLAGIAAIFSRIVLTFSEFLFLGFSFLWKNAKK